MNNHERESGSLLLVDRNCVLSRLDVSIRKIAGAADSHHTTDRLQPSLRPLVAWKCLASPVQRICNRGFHKITSKQISEALQAVRA